MKLIFRLLLVSFMLFIGSSAALACTCAGGGAVCQKYFEAKAVFIGTVIDSKTVTVKQSGFTDQLRSVRFSIDEGFRGAEGGEIEVLTGFGGGDCGFGFRQSKQYLVYAYDGGDGALSTSICSRTSSIEKAVEDLAYIRGLPNAKPGSSVRVSVIKPSRDSNSGLIETPLSGLTVLIAGKQEKTYKTDAKGMVEVRGLAPGAYEITLSLPDGVMTPEPARKVEIADRGCAYVTYYVETNGRLSGRVLSALGFPIANAQLYLTEANKKRYQGHGDFAITDENGDYSFRRIPAGKYVLAVRYDGKTDQMSPFPPVYVPGTPHKPDAQVITLAEGQLIERFNLTMPPLPAEYEVEGTVESLNGEAPRVEYRIGDEPVVYSVEVKDGTFRFKAYEGLQLMVQATQKLGEQKWGASKPAPVTIVAGLPPLKLVITPQP